MGTTVPVKKIPFARPLSTIAPKEMKWLWYPYIPLGTVTAIFGQGGQGKSYMTCKIASDLSNGTALPDTPPPAGPQKILMLSAEDDYATVLVPRLIKLGANLDNIAVPSFQFTLDGKGGDNVSELMKEFSATVLFIDPIVFYAGGKMDMNRSNEVRAMMEKLKDSAEKADSAVIIVGHVKKSEEGGDQNRMMGSADWVNASRSGILVSKTNDGTKVMRHVKTNYGHLGETRGFEITDEGFTWTTVFDEDELPSLVGSGARDQAIAFLRTLLANGPVPAEEVHLSAKDQGIAPATLNRAKVGVAESYYSKAHGFMWKLVGQEA
jgi:hypothetical protein